MPLQYFEKWVHNHHTDSVDCIGFSEDGAFLASSSMDGTIIICNAASGTALHIIHCRSGAKIQTLCFRAHNCPIEHLAFDCSGLKLATGAQQELKVWKYIAQGCLLATYLYQGIICREPESGETCWAIPLRSLIGHADLSPDETQIAIFNQHNGIDVYKIPGTIWLTSYHFTI
ncbi:WD40-repeat-containing domain protein, partial [Suillus discolor]